jgi:hypothetical protein
MSEWMKTRWKIVPIWSTSCDRVVFVRWSKYKAWERKKMNPHVSFPLRRHGKHGNSRESMQE